MHTDHPRAFTIGSRSFYAASISGFLSRSDADILAALTAGSTFAVELTQRDAWIEQVQLLRNVLAPYANDGQVHFEFAVPMAGHRIDVLLLIRHVLFVLEFKAGEDRFSASATEQVWDYALDLKNFHSTSHDKPIAPILIATRAKALDTTVSVSADLDGVLKPVHASPEQLPIVIREVLSFCKGPVIDPADWKLGRYSPTPSIIEAALALYGGHDVCEISRSDAGAINLAQTSSTITEIIESSRQLGRKSICFVTGVPGSGKTLVGLNIATWRTNQKVGIHSVFLSGNGPLVAILREALARDSTRCGAGQANRLKLGPARRTVKALVQNVHHFRDECMIDSTRPPFGHVAVFDEAQRAWDLTKTASFMLRKRNCPQFTMSEPEFLISCMDRHTDWAVVLCLVGGGQEIHTGEAGIAEWIRAVVEKFPHWRVHLSPTLHDSEFAAGRALEMLDGRDGVCFDESLHLAVSMRSFRAEHVAALVKNLLDLNLGAARSALNQLRDRYPIVLTRDFQRAKAWLKSKARGSERYGLIASSQAQRLKPIAINVRVPIDPVHWFLDSKEDVRSSFYLEDVATEFHVQGLELDWACVVWDADFRHTAEGWRYWSFAGNRWKQIQSDQRQSYLKNAYRVLLTRARQGMVIVIPAGDRDDRTRAPEFYDETFKYLCNIGFQVIP